MAKKVTSRVAKRKVPKANPGAKVEPHRAPYAVVACTDKAQLPFACMAVITASRHLDGLTADLYVVAQGCSHEDLDYAREFCRSQGAKVNVIFFDRAKNFAQDQKGGHITSATYLRLYLDELLPAHYEKVLYLDTDTLVVDSIKGLMQMDLGGKYFAAHADRFLEVHRKQHLSEFLDINKVGCFNAGVLLLNWPLVLKDDLLKKTLALSKLGYRFYYADQDMLNVAANGNWHAMDGKFNASRYVISAGEKPVIMHFVSLEKPWGANYYMRQLKYRRAYKSFVKGTRWENYIKPKTPVGWAIVLWEPVMWWQQRQVGRQWLALDKKRNHSNS